MGSDTEDIHISEEPHFQKLLTQSLSYFLSVKVVFVTTSVQSKCVTSQDRSLCFKKVSISDLITTSIPIPSPYTSSLSG